MTGLTIQVRNVLMKWSSRTCSAGNNAALASWSSQGDHGRLTVISFRDTILVLSISRKCNAKGPATCYIRKPGWCAPRHSTCDSLIIAQSSYSRYTVSVLG